MDFYDELHKAYPKLYHLMSDISDESIKTKIKADADKYSKMWDSGNTIFTSMLDFTKPPKRKAEDEDKERQTLIEWFANDIWKHVLNTWLKGIKRDDLVQALNTFGSLNPEINISIDNSHFVNLGQVVDIWNGLHQQNEQIYSIPGFEL